MPTHREREESQTRGRKEKVRQETWRKIKEWKLYKEGGEGKRNNRAEKGG